MTEQKEKSPIKKEIDQERNELLVRIEEWLDGPVLFLGFIWLILIVKAWPESVEGRVLAFIISLYALGILGYLAATFASFFIGQDTKKEEPNAPVMAQLEEIKKAIEELKEK